jgi:hypothetical protein
MSNRSREAISARNERALDAFDSGLTDRQVAEAFGLKRSHVRELRISLIRRRDHAQRQDAAIARLKALFAKGIYA